MGLRFVRKPSEEPNVQNSDDARAFRYAYGNQNGFVKGQGFELEHEINGLEFKIKSGEIVLQGYASVVDSAGITITIDSISQLRYFVVYYEVNLALQTTEIKATFSTSTYPTISAGDDLNTNPTGIARLSIYRFAVMSNNIINEQFTTKLVKEIQYINPTGTYPNITVGNATNAVNAENAVNASNASNAATGSALHKSLIGYEGTVIQEKDLPVGSIILGREFSSLEPINITPANSRVYITPLTSGTYAVRNTSWGAGNDLLGVWKSRGQVYMFTNPQTNNDFYAVLCQRIS